jgi:MerR family transcriptional regulator/heat shock protein HspR
MIRLGKRQNHDTGGGGDGAGNALPARGVRHLGGLRALRGGPAGTALVRAARVAGPGPHRGGTHRYSNADLHRLQRITDLIGTGVNLAGIAQILHLQTTNTQLETDNAQLRATQEADHGRAHPVRR